MTGDKKEIGFFYKLVHGRILQKIIYMVLLVAVTVNVSDRGGAFSYVLFYVVVAYPIMSLIYIIYSVFMLHIYQETEQRIIHKNVPQRYHLIFENICVLPISGICFSYDEGVTHFTKDFTEKKYKLYPGEKIEIETNMVFRFAGGYDAGLTHYYIEDLFGLFRIKKRIAVPVRVHVLPVITNIAHDAINKLNSDRETGNLMTLFKKENYLGNDLRKYVDGDSMNTVHWKNYARTGEMYVRLPDNQESEMFTLVLITEETDGSIDSLKRRDMYLEYLVSIGEYFGSEKKPVMIYYYNAGVKRFLIDNLKSFQEFYMDVLYKIGTSSLESKVGEVVEAAEESFGKVVLFKEDDLSLAWK